MTVITKPDFSGWATKYDIECSDGRTIMPEAFKHQDKVRVPLVWQHGHDDPSKVLGHAILHYREGEGIYADGYFNDTESGKNARELVKHEDINALSIFANSLKERAKRVVHGVIREVSLVLAGANTGALIDNLQIAHADGSFDYLDGEAIIHTGLTFKDFVVKHEEAPKKDEEAPKKGAEGEKTVKDVYDDMTEEQQQVVHFLIGEAEEKAKTNDEPGAEHSGITPKEGTEMGTRNIFEGPSRSKAAGSSSSATLQHDAVTIPREDIREIIQHARESKSTSLKEALEAYVGSEKALKHGIDDIELLFPDARSITSTPEFDKRRTEWVTGVWNGTHKTPFSRIKSLVADITEDRARAKGYIKGNMKKEEFFGLVRRITTPATLYKKQKLDRDDIIDVTDFDIVVWMKAEMRIMFEEELARAILIGDGRDPSDEDKIKDPIGAVEGAGIRSILFDHDLYAPKVYVDLDGPDSTPQTLIDTILLNRRIYKGSGAPTFYTTGPVITQLLLAKDAVGRRLYNTESELASALRVSSIVEVEVMEDVEDLIGIIVNLQDYTIGADKGGETTFFEDFDIDFNQYKYLYEARLSGALTKIRSALVIHKADSGATLVKPNALSFNPATGVIDHVAQTGVVYKRSDTSATVSADITLTEGQTLKIFAVPASGYYFQNTSDNDWTYTRPAAS